MADHAQQARHVLRVLAERGGLALEALRSGSEDEAARLLRGKRAAFANFRALDHLAMKSGVDLAKEPEIHQLAMRITATDQLIAEELARIAEQVREEEQKLRNSRNRLSRYKSGLVRKHGFERSV